MAKVIQIVESDEDALVDGEWHAILMYPYQHTVCGVQLEGEDGVMASPERNGKVTCTGCRRTIDEIQKIKNWK
jgi:hypothetical protein